MDGSNIIKGSREELEILYYKVSALPMKRYSVTWKKFRLVVMYIASYKASTKNV